MIGGGKMMIVIAILKGSMDDSVDDDIMAEPAELEPQWSPCG